MEIIRKSHFQLCSLWKQVLLLTPHRTETRPPFVWWGCYKYTDYREHHRLSTSLLSWYVVDEQCQNKVTDEHDRLFRGLLIQQKMTFLTAAINLLTIFWINRLVVQFIKEKYVDQCLQKFKMMPSSVLLCPRPRFTQFTVRN